MPIGSLEHRPVTAREYPEAMRLWVEVFGVESPFFESLLEAESTPDLSYGTFVDGQLISSVHVFPRKLVNRSGGIDLVGGIGSVSTKSDHRQKGYSGKLLELAIAGMENGGYQWSLLGTGVHDHYARFGWRTVSTPSWMAKIQALRPLPSPDVSVIIPDEATIAEMARLYAAQAPSQPLAQIRSANSWTNAIRYRIDPIRATVFGYQPQGQLLGYLVLTGKENRRKITEISVSPDAPHALTALIQTAINFLPSDLSDLEIAVPFGHALASNLAPHISSIRPSESRAMMARPIADRISWPDLAALYADPRGRFCDLDQF